MKGTMTRTPLPIAVTANPHFHRLGGRPAIERLVQAFYRAMETRPEARSIRAMHAPDLEETRRVLINYLCEWTGGPKAYTEERGTPMLRRRHQPFNIDQAARDAWMNCMRQALEETGVEPALRAELDAAFYKLAEFLRNIESHGAVREHPGRPRETAPGQTAAAHASSPQNPTDAQPRS